VLLSKRIQSTPLRPGEAHNTQTIEALRVRRSDYQKYAFSSNSTESWIKVLDKKIHAENFLINPLRDRPASLYQASITYDSDAGLTPLLYDPVDTCRPERPRPRKALPRGPAFHFDCAPLSTILPRRIVRITILSATSPYPVEVLGERKYLRYRPAFSI
jgi:hypothetical protein